MRNSIKLFLTIILILFVTDRITYYTLSSLEEKIYQGDSVGKFNRFLKVKDSVKNIFIGNSRVAHHIDTQLFSESSYNCGLNGSKLDYSAALVSLLKMKNQNIWVHIDHNNLYDLKYKIKDANSLLYKSLKISELHPFFENHFKHELFWASISKSHVYNGKVFGIIKNTIYKKSFQSFNDGFEPIFPSKTQKEIFLSMWKKTGYQQNINIQKPLKVSSQITSLIDTMVKKAKENNSKIIFFTSPSLNKVDNEVKTKTKIYFAEKGIIYLDNIDFFNKFEVQDWKDHTHMSNIGAKKYSSYLQTLLSD